MKVCSFLQISHGLIIFLRLHSRLFFFFFFLFLTFSLAFYWILLTCSPIFKLKYKKRSKKKYNLLVFLQKFEKRLKKDNSSALNRIYCLFHIKSGHLGRHLGYLYTHQCYLMYMGSMINLRLIRTFCHTTWYVLLCLQDNINKIDILANCFS